MAKKNRNIEYIVLPNKDAWMTTFSDMVTLLITFFVLLISMSSMDSKALKEMFGFFNEAMGPIEYTEVQEVQGLPSIVDTAPPKIFIDSLSLNRNILNALEKKGASGFAGRGKDVLEVRESYRGLVILLNGDVLFEKGSSEVSSDAAVILNSVAEVIKESEATISIEGHTDDQGNMQELYRLSLRRSVSILNYFVYTTGMSPTRFGVAGYGAARPVDTNTTKNGRARNRRVEILLLKQRL